MDIKYFVVGPVMTNCYLLADEKTKQAALIDPGDRGARLAAQIRAAGYELTMILLTHGHFDHIGGVQELLAALKREQPEREIPVYIHPSDYPVAPASFAREATLEGVENVRFYKDGDTLQLSDLTIEVIETPGHTKGGVTLKVGDALFTGDTLFAGSCGRTDFPTSSDEEMMASLKKLAQLEGDFRVFPGHEGFSTLEQERRSNPYVRYALAH